VASQNLQIVAEVNCVHSPSSIEGASPIRFKLGGGSKGAFQVDNRGERPVH
jgi:hypothetical protein